MLIILLLFSMDATFSTDATSKLDVLGHDGDTIYVDGAEVCVLKKPNMVGLCCLVQGKHVRSLEAETFWLSFVIICDLMDQPAERCLV